MRTHLLNVHKRDPDKKEDKDDAGSPVPSTRQATLTMFRAKTKEMSVARQTEVTKSLALMCALDLRPVSIVSGRGFKNFCSKINPSYHVPCRTTVTKHLEFIYEECKKDLIEMLADCSVSLTTDMWTSVGTRSYLTLTGHFINNKWQLSTQLIATRPIDFFFFFFFFTGTMVQYTPMANLFTENFTCVIYTIDSPT